MYFNIINIFYRIRCYARMSVLCQGRGSGKVRGFLSNATPRDNMSKCHTLKFCIFSHFAVLFQKPLLLGNKLLKPNH